MPYGAVSPQFKERFEPGAFTFNPDGVILNAMHDRRKPLARYPGGGLELIDSPKELRISATLPPTRDGDDTLELVRRKILKGLSIEFDAKRERSVGGIRVISQAVLGGIGVVDRAAYKTTTVEVRQRLGRIKATIPYNRALDCRCKRGCDTATFKPGAFAAYIDDPDQEILAIRSSYSDTLGSKKAGSLRFLDTPEGLTLEIDIPETAAGKDLVESVGAVRILARPVWDDSLSGFVQEGTTAIVEAASLRAILLGATDSDKGWPSVAFTPEKRSAPRRRYVL